MLTSCACSPADEAFAEPFDPPYDGWITWGAIGGFTGKFHQFRCMKTCREPFQALCRNSPVTIAARPLKKIQVMVEAFGEGRAKLRNKRGILSRGRCDCRVEGSAFI